MQGERETIDLLRARLERLERAHRRLVRMVSVVLVGSAALLLMGQTADRLAATTIVGRTVEAQVIVLRDTSGKVRMLLDADAGEPTSLTLSDRHGRERMALGIGPAGGVGLVFRDKEGQIRTALGVGPEGRPFFLPKRGPVNAGY